MSDLSKYIPLYLIPEKDSPQEFADRLLLAGNEIIYRREMMEITQSGFMPITCEVRSLATKAGYWIAYGYGANAAEALERVVWKVKEDIRNGVRYWFPE